MLHFSYKLKKQLKAESCDMKVNKRETFLDTFINTVENYGVYFNFSNITLHISGT
jgi:hypothetical protein